MTNNMIIMNASIELMKEGKLKGTGEFARFTDDNGNYFEQEIPEEIHTFQGWKSRGFQVKKGEKSKIKITIWKHVTKKAKEDTASEELNKMNQAINEQGGEERMFMTTSAFFTASQVEPLKARA